MIDSKNSYEWDFWKSLWQAAFACLSVLTVSVASCTAYETSLVSDAVKSGVDPIAADCGIRGSGGESRRVLCLANSKKDSAK